MRAIPIVLLCLCATACGLVFLYYAFMQRFGAAILWLVGGFALLFLLEWLAWRMHK